MSAPGDLAIPHGADPDELRRAINRAHDDFVMTGRTTSNLRSIVADSWLRSVAVGLDPERSLAPIVVDDDDLREIRDAHPLAAAMPVIRRLLVESAEQSGLLVAVSDAVGQLLWVEGARDLLRRAEHMHFMPGTRWAERDVGTNAPGTALALDAPVQILGAEHLARSVTDWSCSAAPIHDPDTGAILGVLDVTGGAEVATPQSLTLVRATVAAVESELRLHRLVPRSTPSAATARPGPATLEVLAGHTATLRVGGSCTRLSVRHSELVLLLSRAGEGLSAAELALELSEDDHALVTIRAELSRLRGLLGSVQLASRPYRLVTEVRADVDRVVDLLDAGKLRGAVDAYRGPILPPSTAPGVERLRDDLHQRVRSALLSASDADALLAFADTAHGRDDLQIWTRTLEVVPRTSPRRAQVEARVAQLDAELAC